MKKLLLSLLAILLFTRCQKEISKDKANKEIAGVAARNHKKHKIKIIPSVTISDQTWMLKIPDVSTCRDGTPIPQVTDQSAGAA